MKIFGVRDELGWAVVFHGTGTSVQRAWTGHSGQQKTLAVPARLRPMIDDVHMIRGGGPDSLLTVCFRRDAFTAEQLEDVVAAARDALGYLQHVAIAPRAPWRATSAVFCDGVDAPVVQMLDGSTRSS